MKRIFVTGASGFIGAAVTRHLVAEGYEVAALLRAHSNAWRLDDVSRRIHSITGSIDAPDSYRDSLLAFSPDTVMHLAWKGVAKAERNASDQVRVNVCGSVDLFHIAAQAGCRSFIGAGSQAEYGPSSEPLTEASPTRPVTLYGSAKLATFVLLSQLAKAHAVRLAWLRVFSIYGPQDGQHTLITSLIRELLAGRKPAVTKAEQRWDYLYVDDAARAFIAVGESDASGLFNLGSGDARPLNEFIRVIRDQIDPSLPIGFGDVEQPDGPAASLQPCVERLHAATSWSPLTPITDGVRATIAYHRNRQHNVLAT